MGNINCCHKKTDQVDKKSDNEYQEWRDALKKNMYANQTKFENALREMYSLFSWKNKKIDTATYGLTEENATKILKAFIRKLKRQEQTEDIKNTIKSLQWAWNTQLKLLGEKNAHAVLANNLNRIFGVVPLEYVNTVYELLYEEETIAGQAEKATKDAIETTKDFFARFNSNKTYLHSHASAATIQPWFQEVHDTNPFPADPVFTNYYVNNTLIFISIIVGFFVGTYVYRKSMKTKKKTSGQKLNRAFGKKQIKNEYPHKYKRKN
jgi:hypothetical protein